MKIIVVGAGAWGTALAVSAAPRHAVTLLARDAVQAGAMRALAELRPPVDDFFDKIMVNADDAKIRENRLKLLSEIRAATQTVADFSKIAG